MSTETTTKHFFEQFFREFKMGLRSEDQPFVDKLIQDLVDISKIIPPTKAGQYSFRETLMLIALINQKLIHSLKSNNRKSFFT